MSVSVSSPSPSPVVGSPSPSPVGSPSPSPVVGSPSPSPVGWSSPSPSPSVSVSPIETQSPDRHTRPESQAPPLEQLQPSLAVGQSGFALGSKQPPANPIPAPIASTKWRSRMATTIPKNSPLVSSAVQLAARSGSSAAWRATSLA